MTIEEACDKAVAEGYHVHCLASIATYYSGANHECSVWTRTDNHSSFVVPMEGTFLDPLFWQALGRALGWEQALRTVHAVDHGRPTVVTRTEHSWLAQWHRFIDALAEGHTAEAFFARLDSPVPAHARGAKERWPSVRGGTQRGKTPRTQKYA
jgi:hypothetical protein